MALTKLKITASSSPGGSGDKGSMEVQVNPESYRFRYGTGNEKKDTKVADGKIFSEKVIDFQNETVSFDIWFDNTGIFENSKDVQSQINQFKDLAVDYEGENHSTNFIKLNWGTLDFECQLTSLDINFELFDKDGNPLRAKMTVSFKRYTAPKEEATQDKDRSPDLSHIYTVKAGDTLPLMCYRVYGESKYYGQVAEANGLSSFMYIQPGKKILFPPLDKFEYNASISNRS